MDNIMTFDENGWLARSYRRFIELGGRKRNPENLCRFFRVAVLWSPIRRFFRGNAPLDFTPAGFCFLISILTGIAALLIWFAYYTIFIDYTTLLVTAWIMWIVVLLFGAVEWIDTTGKRVATHKYRNMKDNIRTVLTTYTAYRKARAGRFCPLIKIGRKSN